MHREEWVLSHLVEDAVRKEREVRQDVDGQVELPASGEETNELLVKQGLTTRESDVNDIELSRFVKDPIEKLGIDHVGLVLVGDVAVHAALVAGARDFDVDASQEVIGADSVPRTVLCRDDCLSGTVFFGRCP